jgi:hypothetical protein
LNRLSIPSIVAVVCALSPVATFAGPAKTAIVELQARSPARVLLESGLSSNTAHEGDRFVFSVTQDVRSSDWIFIPARTHGNGVVVRVEGASSNGPPG